ANSNQLVLASTGSVGIGTGTPANKLDVNGGEAVGTYAGSAGLSNGLVVSGNVGFGVNGSQTGYEADVAGGGDSTQNNNAYAAIAGLNTSTTGGGYAGSFSLASLTTGYGVYSIASGIGNTGYAG